MICPPAFFPPPTEAAAGATYVSTNGFNVTGITAIRPFVGNTVTITGQNANGVSGNYDEIRVGGTWASVTSAVVVPEPSTLILAGLGLIGLLGVGRRLRKSA